MSRFLKFVPSPLRQRPQIALALAFAAVAGVILVAIVVAAAMAPTPTQPNSDVAGAPSATWTLAELQAHAASKDVVAIGVAPESDSAPAGLLAKEANGTLVRVQTDVAPSSALSALQALGYGDLFTAGAWQSVTQTGSQPADTSSSGGGGVLQAILAVALPVAVIGGLLFVMIRFSNRSMGRRDSTTNFQTIMPARPDDPANRTAATAVDPRDPKSGGMRPRERLVRLEDVAGCDEAKLELTETIEFLKTPERFRRLGASIPRGILLYGPPGTGKTMLAKAVASEAGVPFHYTSGSEFVEKYVGVGARRMRDLFNQAKKLGRGVIFVDEFDALGKARGGNNSHEEREQTLNQLLVEMDGFSTVDDIVVIAATNRIDVLDSAVLRPGRFNRKIHVGLPDVVGRKAILEVHARNKPLESDVDLEGIARKTYGFSGAQLADLLNEGAIFAARAGKDAIGNDELHQGWLKVAVGTGRKRSMDERERSIIAAHEVGHAICGRVHGDKRTVEEISLFAHGEALGVTVSSQEDNDLPAESDLRARLVALMGGRAAEELLFQEVTAGASNDFEKANNIATMMVTRWGMGADPDSQDGGKSGRGSLSLFVARGNGGLPNEVQGAATRAIRAILDEAYEDACNTLVAQMDKLRAISSFLVEHERVDGETFAALFDGTLAVVDATREWRPASARPRDWEEIARYVEGRRSRTAWPAELERRKRPDEIDDGSVEPDPVGAATRAAAGTAETPVANGRRSTDARSNGPGSNGSGPNGSGPNGSGPNGSGPRSGGSTRSGRSAFRRRVRTLAHGWLVRADGWVADGKDKGSVTRRS